ncbi:MAG: hypothetical protein KF729_19405 [Sandaracinaceae bacterium]|nr:hypothetical protein [Sandaracinaceae bacterium]
MRLWLLLVTTAVAGCSPAAAAAWVPAVRARAVLVEAERGSARSRGESWSWSVSVDASWPLDRVGAEGLAQREPPRAVAWPRQRGCASEPLCAWERRARVRALERLRTRRTR